MHREPALDPARISSVAYLNILIVNGKESWTHGFSPPFLISLTCSLFICFQQLQRTWQVANLAAPNYEVNACASIGKGMIKLHGSVESEPGVWSVPYDTRGRKRRE